MRKSPKFPKIDLSTVSVCEVGDILRKYILSQKQWIHINLKKKRNRKKFEKNSWDYISKRVKKHYIGYILSIPIRRVIDYPCAFRKIVDITPVTTLLIDN